MSYPSLSEEIILEYAKYSINASKKSMPLAEYAKKYNVDYKKLSNIYYRIFWLKIGNFKERPIRDKYIDYAKKFLTLKNITVAKFVRDESIDRGKFTIALQHVKYWDIINKYGLLKENNEPIKEIQLTENNKIEPMKFISIKSDERLSINPIKEQEPQQELIKKKNEIELNISKGIKVIVDSDVNTETMIRIIELLKDL